MDDLGVVAFSAQHMSAAVLGQSAPAVPGAAPAASAPAASAPTIPGAPATAAPGGAAPGARPPGGGLDFMLIMMLVLVAMIVFTSMAGRKQRRQREAMLSSIKRGDRVATNSGIIGTIAELYDQEMVLRVDEASNTRIRMQRSAIAGVIREGGAATGTVETKPAAGTPAAT